MHNKSVFFLFSTNLAVHVFCLQEDMNLNEDRKAPLREKDLAIKKEMVMQYMSTASQAVSILWKYARYLWVFMLFKKKITRSNQLK